MRYYLFFFTVFFINAAVAVGATVKDYKADAEASLFYGDFFHSFRSYNYIETESPNYFKGQALQGYLQSLFVIGDKNTISAECERLAALKDLKASAKARYFCGKYFLETKNTKSAERYLKDISTASNFFWPGQILRATNDLILNDAPAALKILKVSDLKKYEKFGLADEFNLALARTYAAENKLDDAIRRFQLIDGKSNFYIEALEETAWAFFKIHRFESAQVLLDVLIGNYETAQRVGNQEVSQSTYYRARYLKAYLALSEKRTDGAALAFSDLRTEYEKSLNVLRPALNPVKVLAAIKNQNQKWTDTNNFPKQLNQQLDLISEWEGADVRKEFEGKILYQMALTRELARTYRFQSDMTSDLGNYQKEIQTLQEKSWGQFSTEYNALIQKLNKDLETLRIKAELGRLEIVWLKRAEGVRSLDEVIDNYRQEAKYLDEFMEK